MTEQSIFERTLERRLLARASHADRPFEASAVARQAIATAPRRAFRLPRLGMIRPAVGWLVILGLLVIAALAGIAGSSGVLPPPAGASLLAVGSSDGLALMDRDGAGGVQPFGDGPAFQPRWSLDGAYVAVTALTDEDPNHLLVYRADGTLVADLAGVGAELEWSPKRYDLAFQEVATNALRVLSVEAGAIRAVQQPGSDLASGFSWAPDGRRIVAASAPAENGELGPAWIIDVGGPGPAAQFGAGDASGLYDPRWSPDGARIAAVERCPTSDCIRIRDAASGQRRAEVNALDSPSGLAWSPDGAWLAFDSGGDLVMASADVETVVPLTSGPALDRLVEWAPDGRSVIVWRIVTEGGQEPYEFWSVPIDGSEPTLLARDAFGVSIRPSVP